MKIITKLDELYSLRDSFSIIGITGRTGSGCSKIAEILERKFDDLENIKEPIVPPKSIRDRKYEIVYNFNKLNWKSHKTIKYRNVLLLILCQFIKYKEFKYHLQHYFKKSLKDDFDKELVDSVNKSLYNEFSKNESLLKSIQDFGDISKLKSEAKLTELAKLFWGDFDVFANRIDDILRNNDTCLIERTVLLHHTAINFRKSGQPYMTDSNDYKNIYFIAHIINRLIKGTKHLNDGKCHIVIDSLRNSLEINFFKERYSGFYLVAVKSDQRKENLLDRYGKNNHDLVNKMLKIDSVEYKCNDFIAGHFFSPDVQNCIQKADYHIITRDGKSSEDEVINDFYSVEQQILKLQGLIQQPGLITPSTIERSMQFAFNAKLNSGCISRQVGAVITDKEFSVKSIGWNDVPRGAIPCCVRNAKDISIEKPFGFTDFELGYGLREKNINIASNETQNPDNIEIDDESKEFNQFLKDNFNDDKINNNDLGGINCPFCFKTVYNKYTGENNQVHTRSLHAEENAMIQISKYGGQPLKNGILFTTASPCELCSKKAYQLGITDIYYIDPYPGISRSHILRNNKDSDPNLHMFYGAIGRGFIKLYEPFLSQKDEISILTNLKIETPSKTSIKHLKKTLISKCSDNEDHIASLEKFFSDEEQVFDKIIKTIHNDLINP